MRNIYNIHGAITKNEDMLMSFNHFLPEISEIKIKFIKPNFSTFDGRMQGNRVDELVVKFENNNSLPIEGKYLHIFFDSPPFAVEDINNEYIEKNPYLNNYSTKEMVDLIRKGFVSLLERVEADTNLEKLLSIEIEYTKKGYNLTKKLYPDLSKRTIELVKKNIIDIFTSHKRLNHPLLVDFIEKALMKPKITRGMIKVGEFIKNDFKEVEWGDVSMMKFQDFLMELDSHRENGVPYYTAYHEKLKEHTRENISSALFAVLKGDLWKDEEAMSEIVSYFNYSNERLPTNEGELAEFLIKEEYSEFEKILLNYWEKKYCNATLSQILAEK